MLNDLFKNGFTGHDKKSAADLFPADDDSLKILDNRAHELSKIIVDENVNLNKINYIKIRLGDNEFYGVDYTFISEILNNFFITVIPRSPEYISGVINHRGSLITILNLKNYFHINHSGNNNEKFIIIIKHKKILLGFMVDGIENSDSYDKYELVKSIKNDKNMKSNHIHGLHKGTVGIFNMEVIFDELEKLL